MSLLHPLPGCIPDDLPSPSRPNLYQLLELPFMPILRNDPLGSILDPTRGESNSQLLV